MKTGLIRKLDDLGRVVIPAELRKILNIEVKDSVEIYQDGNKVIVEKIEPTCIFCGDTSDVENFKDKKVCKNCKVELIKKKVSSNNG